MLIIHTVCRQDDSRSMTAKKLLDETLPSNTLMPGFSASEG